MGVKKIITLVIVFIKEIISLNLKVKIPINNDIEYEVIIKTTIQYNK